MSNITHKLTAGIALLLIGLFLTIAVIVTTPYIARANPDVLYVSPTAEGNGNCSNWANACTLQTALSQAVSGNEIWVKAGVYYPGAAGNREATFTLKNDVALYGGFAGTETSRDQRDWQVNVTILSGDIDQNDDHGGDYINENALQIMGSNAYHVVTGGGTNASSVLDGFVITAGQASSSYGGGLYNYESSPTLTNVAFSGNSALGGGGMYNYKSSPSLTNVVFSGNSATSGGGIYNYQSSPTLSNASFSGNSANHLGGGMYNRWMSNPTLTNVTFNSNSAEYGGGMYNEWVCFPTLTNVTFSGNSASMFGGGMYNYESAPTLTNVIIWGNSALSLSSIGNSSSKPFISHSDIQGCGSSSSWNSDCGRDGGGNIAADPIFVNAPAGNLRLQAGSPCIDAGDTLAVPVEITTDLDGNPRISGVSVDMGAYEFQWLTTTKFMYLPHVLTNH